MRFQEIQEACWTGYRQAGMKKKGDRQVPNCVPVAEVKTGPEITGRDLLFKAAAMAMRDASHEGVSLDYEQAIRQASKIYGIPYTPSELPKLLAQRAEIDRQLALLKQGKQVAKARRQAKRAPTPAGTDEYWRTHALPTDRIKPPAKSLEEATDPFLDNAARELLGVVLMFSVPFAIGVYIDLRNKLRKYQGKEIIDALERKGVTMNRETYEKVKPVLDQFKQALRDNDGAEAKALAKRIEQMIIMGKLSASAPQAADTALAAKEKELAEDLKKWFREKWVRFGPDGKIRGDCARGSSKEGKPKCLPQSKAHALGKKGRASAAAKKRREDPNAERRGPAKNVATKVKEVKDINAISNLIKQSGASNAFQQADDKRKQAEALLVQLKDLQNKRQQLAIKRIKPSQEYYQELDRIVTAIGDLGYEAEGPTNGQYTLRAKFKEQHDWDDADEFGMPGSEFFYDDDRLRDGDYVRDRQDGESGEIFRMSGDPSERRVRILDRDGRGWYISPERLVAVDRTDPDIMKYFGKRREVDEKQDACYRKVKSRYKVWPSAYASGALVQCRKKGVANWGTGAKKK
jgi:hypothetical protein